MRVRSGLATARKTTTCVARPVRRMIHRSSGRVLAYFSNPRGSFSASARVVALCSGSLRARRQRSTALAAARLAPRVSVDLSSTTAIEEVGVARFLEALDELEPEVVFANEDEAALVGELEYETVVKRGAAGCRVGGREYPAESADVVDPTGAGDAFAAGYLLEGPDLALAAAARCVAKMGSMP